MLTGTEIEVIIAGEDAHSRRQVGTGELEAGMTDGFALAEAESRPATPKARPVPHR
ncbi:MAG TPA: hypothetical protein VFA23_15355 [Dongiaceae bacterium]|nr:hypothetical protein [Dongiaceae bacterium]